MNCQEFAVQVGALADDRLTDAAVRKSALAHAMACLRCAALLTDERVLTSGLRVLALSTAHAEAPSRLKQALRAAFDQRHAAPAPVAATALQFKPQSSRLASWLAAWLGWPALMPQRWALAAAALLVLFGATLALWLRDAASTQMPNTVATASPTPVATPVQQSTELTAAPSNLPTNLNANNHAPHTNRPRPRRSAAAAAAAAAAVAAAPLAQQLAASTEFIPLTYTADPQAMRNGLLVHVEVPRASLLALGLPLNAERTSEKVKAEVMMGENGVAYAIRLVNETRP